VGVFAEKSTKIISVPVLNLLKKKKKKRGRIVLLSSLARQYLNGNDLKKQKPSFSGVEARVKNSIVGRSYARLVTRALRIQSGFMLHPRLPGVFLKKVLCFVFVCLGFFSSVIMR